VPIGEEVPQFRGLADSVFQVYIVEELSPWTLFTLKTVDAPPKPV